VLYDDQIIIFEFIFGLWYLEYYMLLTKK